MENLSAKIIELAQNVFVIPGNTNVGVILNEIKGNDSIELYLVDSGCTEIDGDYILDVLKAFFDEREQKFKIKAIISTHGHADHVGAHNYLKQETGCKILATKHEQGGMETPMIQCTTLWGGYPPHELRTLYFKPEETYVDDFIKEGDNIPLSDSRFISFLSLTGHSHSSVAVIINYVDDKKVVFAGDNIFPKNEIIKHWVPLIINPVQYMDSLDKLCSIQNIEWCIPSHGDFLKKNIEEAAEMDKIAIISTRMCIMDCLQKKKQATCEEIVKYVADKNDFNMSLGQLALVTSTVKSYLSVMHDAKEIKMKVEDNILYFYIN